jgi:hypothetical protein
MAFGVVHLFGVQAAELLRSGHSALGQLGISPEMLLDRMPSIECLLPDNRFFNFRHPKFIH